MLATFKAAKMAAGDVQNCLGLLEVVHGILVTGLCKETKTKTFGGGPKRTHVEGPHICKHFFLGKQVASGAMESFCTDCSEQCSKCAIISSAQELSHFAIPTSQAYMGVLLRVPLFVDLKGTQKNTEAILGSPLKKPTYWCISDRPTCQGGVGHVGVDQVRDTWDDHWLKHAKTYLIFQPPNGKGDPWSFGGQEY